MQSAGSHTTAPVSIPSSVTQSALVHYKETAHGVLRAMSAEIQSRKQRVSCECSRFMDEQVAVLASACAAVQRLLTDTYDSIQTDIDTIDREIDLCHGQFSDVTVRLIAAGLHARGERTVWDCRSELEKRVEVVQRGAEHPASLTKMMKTWEVCDCSECSSMQTVVGNSERPLIETERTGDPQSLWDKMWTVSYCTCANSEGKPCDMCRTEEEKSAEICEKRDRETAIETVKQNLERLVLMEKGDKDGWKCGKCEERNREGEVGCANCGLGRDRTVKKVKKRGDFRKKDIQEGGGEAGELLTRGMGTTDSR